MVSFVRYLLLVVYGTVALGGQALHSLWHDHGSHGGSHGGSCCCAAHDHDGHLHVEVTAVVHLTEAPPDDPDSSDGAASIDAVSIHSFDSCRDHNCLFCQFYSLGQLTGAQPTISWIAKTEQFQPVVFAAVLPRISSFCGLPRAPPCAAALS